MSLLMSVMASPGSFFYPCNAQQNLVENKRIPSATFSSSECIQLLQNRYVIAVLVVNYGISNTILLFTIGINVTEAMCVETLK